MKKFLCIMFAVLLVTALSSCDKNEATVTENETETASAVQASSDGSDVDLTQLSSTMVYSEVYNMMTNPENYVGKTVKMNGAFSVFQDESTGKIYFSCIIKDATACCSQGLEFRLADERTYPDDYPEEGADITVTGTFNTYYEGENMYCELKDSVME